MDPGPDVLGSPYDARPWLASYPEGVPADFDFPAVPLTQLLDDAAASFPTATALAFLGTTLTYRELRDVADHLAAGLADLGVCKGDRVCLVLPNCPQAVLASFAALRLGAVVVAHNPLSSEAELRHQIADSGARVVVCLDRVLPAITAVRPDTALEHVVVTSLADYLPAAARLGLRLPFGKARRARAELTAPVPRGTDAHRFLGLLKTPRAARQTPVDPETDAAHVLYTGGTTGAARGVVLTHDNIVSNAYMNRLWDTGATAGKEVTLGVLPLFHAYGLTVVLYATVLLGGTLVLLPRFDLRHVFAAVDRWRPTMLPGVPPIYRALSESPELGSHDLRSLRVCVSGAMSLPAAVQEQFERASGALLVEGYGLTEASPATHCNPLSAARRAGTIGLPLPGTRCRVVDQEDPTREVPVGEPGELAVAGRQVFPRYWGGDDDTGPRTPDGYLLTGDVVTMDPDGFFTVVDRKKDLIITGGFNVYPSEVEEVLSHLPGVSDVVVAGLPDRYRGETVKAYVVREPGSDLTAGDVVEHCARELSAYKVPRAVEFRDDLPRSVVGKVLRRLLVEQDLATARDGPAQVRKSAPPDGRST